MSNFLIDASVQALIDTNSEDISAVYPSFLSRSFTEDVEFVSHPNFRVYTHFTNIKMLCLRESPASITSIEFLVNQHPKNKKWLVSQGQPFVAVNGQVFTAPFDAEVVAFNTRLLSDPSLAATAASSLGHLAFVNRRFSTKRKLDS